MGNNTPSSAPVPQEKSVLRDLYNDGAGADLSHVNDGINVQLEKNSAKQLNAAQREHLAAQIDAWRTANKDVADVQKLDEKAKVLDLLQELKDDINPPALPRVASEMGSSIANIGHQSVEDVAVSGEKIINKVTGDWNGLWKGDVPVADKILTGAKYVAGAVGLVWVAKWLNKKWHDMTGTGWMSHIGKWIGAVGLGLGGAKLLANTTDRSFGPRLSQPAASPAPAPAPATAGAPKSAPNVAPKLAKELVNDPAGIVTPDGIRASLSMSMLSTTPEFNVDGRTFIINNLSPAEMGLSRFLSVKEDGNYMEMNGGMRMEKAEFNRVVKDLKNSKNVMTPMMVTLEKPDASGVYQKVTRNFIFKRTSAA